MFSKWIFYYQYFRVFNRRDTFLDDDAKILLNSWGSLVSTLSYPKTHSILPSGPYFLLGLNLRRGSNYTQTLTALLCTAWCNPKRIPQGGHIFAPYKVFWERADVKIQL
jgi:hypothetical protein